MNLLWIVLFLVICCPVILKLWYLNKEKKRKKMALTERLNSVMKNGACMEQRRLNMDNGE